MAFRHIGYTCNGCGDEPIIGKRWHCYACKRAGRDFNICDYCYKKFSHPHDLGAIQRNSKKVREIHRIREKDKREGYIVDPDKYNFTPDKLNRRFARNVTQEPLERGSKKNKRSKHARSHPPSYNDELEHDNNYFADLI